VTLRFVSFYGVPLPAQEQAATDVTAALAADALSPLPAHRFALDDIVAAHEAVEKGVTGKILVDIP
jgi:NADPH2:quinone reductase